MARYNKPIATEGSIIGGLILDSRDLFEREKFEERLDYQLAVLTQQFYRDKKVDRQQVQNVVEDFIKDVGAILVRLEDAKRRAEQEEAKKIDKLRQLLAEGTKINSKKFKKELEKFGSSLKSNTVSTMRQYVRREKRLRRGKAPIGYFLKKVRQDKALEADIARRTGNLVKDAQQEHQLISEIDYLIKALNSSIPDKKTYANLKERIRLLADNYEKDLEDFLNIEIDIEIEEARKLHRIDHYITFLKMVGGFDGLINKLNELKKRVEYWIYQDSIDAKKLIRYAKSLDYGLSTLKASEALHDKDFPGIIATNSPIDNIVPGILIYNQNKPKPNRAVILMHGVFQSKETLLTFGKKLASLDFWVYSIDMTSHGESREKINLGRNCEYIQIAVRWFRLNGIKNVGVIGHSLGAVTTLFALCGYNVKVENEFYTLVTKIMQRLKIIIETINKNVVSEHDRAIHEAIKLSEEYKDLKKLVVNAMRSVYEGQSKINVAVLLAAPLTVQFVFPPLAAKILKRLPKQVHWLAGKSINKLFNRWSTQQEGKDTPVYKPLAKKGEVQVMSAVYSDIYHTYNYAQTVKNPYDFINFRKLISL